MIVDSMCDSFVNSGVHHDVTHSDSYDEAGAS